MQIVFFRLFCGEEGILGDLVSNHKKIFLDKEVVIKGKQIKNFLKRQNFGVSSQVMRDWFFYDI